MTNGVEKIEMLKRQFSTKSADKYFLTFVKNDGRRWQGGGDDDLYMYL